MNIVKESQKIITKSEVTVTEEIQDNVFKLVTYHRHAVFKNDKLDVKWFTVHFIKITSVPLIQRLENMYRSIQR